MAGGVVAYSNEAKMDLLGVDPGLIEAKGAVSPEVAEAMAIGALERFDADVAVSITGIAGPGGGSEEKPVGYVCFNARLADGTSIARDPVIPGGRLDIRERSALVGMHLLRMLLGERRRHEAVAEICFAVLFGAPSPRSVAAVAKERLKSPRARLFVALDLPDELREGIAAWGGGAGRSGAAAGRAGVPARHPRLPRLPAGEGDRGDRRGRAGKRRSGALGGAARPGAAAAAGEGAALRAAGALPGPERCRRALGEGLAEAGFYEPEKRPFWPHVTVARVRPRAGIAAAGGRLRPPGKFPQGCPRHRFAAG